MTATPEAVELVAQRLYGEQRNLWSPLWKDASEWSRRAARAHARRLLADLDVQVTAPAADGHQHDWNDGTCQGCGRREWRAEPARFDPDAAADGTYATCDDWNFVGRVSQAWVFPDGEPLDPVCIRDLTERGYPCDAQGNRIDRSGR